jgi:hypothetical protein
VRRRAGRGSQRRMSRATILITLTLLLGACAGDRLTQLENRLAEQRSETERLARDLADLRRQATSSAAPGAGAPSLAGALNDRVGALEATLRGVVEALSRTLPATTARVDGALAGVWRAPSTGAESPEETLHFTKSGQLCGYRLLPGGTKEPFWGTWEKHGRVVVELHDRWVGDHNEHGAIVRVVRTLDDATLALDGDTTRTFTHVPESAWPAMRSLYEDRAVPIPGLPTWCLSPP